MHNLKKAHQELFRRTPDETYGSLQTLHNYCSELKRNSDDRWHAPSAVGIECGTDGIRFTAGLDGAFLMNDWSFSQICRMAGVAKDTVNRLTPETASQVFQETLRRDGNKPLQLLLTMRGHEHHVRSVHGTQYTRLWNADLVSLLMEYAVDFQPPQAAQNEGTGLYAGEQDMFVFLIDPAGWCEIGNEAFAPGFFVWNSEVGRRSLGIQTFWFQSVCRNHIVWDAVEVVEWKRKHTAKVGEGLNDIRRIIEGLVAKRDQRQDGFMRVIRQAMETRLGQDADEALKQLTRQGITKQVAQRALDIAREQGAFTIWSLVDALTRISKESQFAGERNEADIKAAQLLQQAVSV